MRKVLLLVLSALVISGCTEKKQMVGNDANTIEKAILESDVGLEDVFHTEKVGKQHAFSLYGTSDGYGILHFDKSDNQWMYGGSSHFQESMEAEDIPPLSFGSSTWVKGDYSSKGENLYATVFYGVVMDDAINKVLIQYNGNEYAAKILHSKGRRFWYLLSEAEDGKERVSKVSGYSSAGKLVYQELVSQK